MNNSYKSQTFLGLIVVIAIVTLTSCSLFRTEVDKGRSYLYFNPHLYNEIYKENTALDSLLLSSTYCIRNLKIEEHSLANDFIIICASDSSDNQYLIVSKIKEKPPRGTTFLESDKCYNFAIRALADNPKYESSYNSYEDLLSFNLGKNISLRCPTTTTVVEALNLTGQWIRPLKMNDPKTFKTIHNKTKEENDSIIITSDQKMRLKNYYEINEYLFVKFENENLSFWDVFEYGYVEKPLPSAELMILNKDYELKLFRVLRGFPNAGIKNWLNPMIVENSKKEFITRPTWPSTYKVANVIGKWIFPLNVNDTIEIK